MQDIRPKPPHKVMLIGVRARGKKTTAADPEAPCCRRGTKRRTTAEQQPPTKRQKTADQPFRFLDLPGELQNRIYELATAESRRLWPVLRNNLRDKSQPRRTRSNPTSTPPPGLRKPVFPFLGLTQTCRKIRSEFRPWWMTVHRIPFCELAKYISVFLRSPPKKDRDRCKTYFNLAGTLRVHVRLSELENMDIISLIRLKVRLPDYKIIFEHGRDVPDVLAFGLNQIVHHRDPVWRQWIRGKRITQLRCRSTSNTHKFHIVVREEWSEPWMKRAINPRMPDNYLRKFDLEDIVYWSFGFAVCY